MSLPSRRDRTKADMIKGLYTDYIPDVIRKEMGEWPIKESRYRSINTKYSNVFDPYGYEYVTCEEAQNLLGRMVQYDKDLKPVGTGVPLSEEEQGGYYKRMDEELQAINGTNKKKFYLGSTQVMDIAGIKEELYRRKYKCNKTGFAIKTNRGEPSCNEHRGIGCVWDGSVGQCLYNHSAAAGGGKKSSKRKVRKNTKRRVRKNTKRRVRNNTKRKARKNTKRNKSLKRRR